MGELALYRKWRSRSFEELVGQPHVTQTLHNAVRLGKIAHAYLFCGPRGTGKTSAAKILAKALNCERGPTPEPCGECGLCRGIAAGAVLDCIEIDAASNRGIDEIRDLREKVRFAPTQCRTKVYIIDEVHMLTTEAFNALLKTLEEPPPQTVFILCTTEPHKLLPTVTSRCQRFDFRRIPSTVIETRLQEVCESEKLQVEPGVISLIAREAGGSLRDALSLLDQLRTFGRDGIRMEETLLLLGLTPQAVLLNCAERVAEGDLKRLLVYLHEILGQGIDLMPLVRDLIHLFRKVLLCHVAPDVVEGTEEEMAFLKKISPRFPPEETYRILKIVSELRNELRYSPHPQLSAEMAFMRLLKAPWEPTLEGLKRRLDLLETRPAAAEPVREPSAPSPVSAPLSLESVQQRWADLVEKLRASRKPLFAILQPCKPVRLEQHLLTLSVPLEFHKSMLEQRKEEVQKVLRETFHPALTFAAEWDPVEHETFLQETTKLFPGAVVVGEHDAQG